VWLWQTVHLNVLTYKTKGVAIGEDSSLFEDDEDEDEDKDEDEDEDGDEDADPQWLNMIFVLLRLRQSRGV